MCDPRPTQGERYRVEVEWRLWEPILTGSVGAPQCMTMEVRMFPNSSRTAGLKPRRETQRPLLPQHSRHCPVLEAGSGLGFLVYAPLEEKESFLLEYQGDGRYHFVYFLEGSGGRWIAIFSITVVLPQGSIGMIKQEAKFLVPDPPVTEEGAIKLARTFVVPEDLGTPPGAISLRGATNFQTPPGWDTVYIPVLNMIDRPVAPMLTVRVETDWYVHETEFRYVLQPGDRISEVHNLPIGQVFFVPREEAVLLDCTEEELAALRETRDQFLHQKAASKVTTRYGLQYSPHYIHQSRSEKR